MAAFGAPTGPLRLAAATGRALFTYDGGWRRRLELPDVPGLIARQARRRRLVVVTRDGGVLRFDADTGASEHHREPAWAGAAAYAYDEILGGLWFAHPRGRAQTVLARIEPWPPRRTYEISAAPGISAMTVSLNGEWLAVIRGADGTPPVLFNVAGQREFHPPITGLDGRIGMVFTYDNHLAAVGEDDRVTVTELPARVDVRAESADIGHLSPFWEGRMEKASRTRRGGAVRSGAAAAGGEP